VKRNVLYHPQSEQNPVVQSVCSFITDGAIWLLTRHELNSLTGSISELISEKLNPLDILLEHL
jgi:hypothetical protein